MCSTRVLLLTLRRHGSVSPGRRREVRQQLEPVQQQPRPVDPDPLLGTPAGLGRVLEVPGGARGRGDGELVGEVVEDAARLDDPLLAVQPLVHGAQQLQNPEPPLQTAQRAREHGPRPPLGRVEARLVLVHWLGERREEVGALLVAPPDWRRERKGMMMVRKESMATLSALQLFAYLVPDSDSNKHGRT